jgi:signal transduction histidine kinase
MLSALEQGKVLRAHPFLAFFDEKLARSLSESAEIRSYREGDRIFSEGEPVDSMYLVLTGSVRLTKKDPAGNAQLLAVVSHDDYFGEFGVLDGNPRSTGALAAVQDTVLARLPRERVLQVFSASGQGMLKVALQIIRKVRDTNELYVKEHVRKERMTLVGEMANTIIHDLRNPFTVIQLCTQMLRSEIKPESLEKCELIESQLARAQSMIEELLEYSRGRPTLNKRPVDISEVLSQFECLFRDYLARSQVELAIQPATRVVNVDTNKMIRVLQNLVNNAVEAFAGKGGKISIGCEEKGGKFVIVVADNGPGIPETMCAVMFEPFATLGKKKGIGLGMAIAKSITVAHGGDLLFETKPGQGTTFFIELPAGPS